MLWRLMSIRSLLLSLTLLLQCLLTGAPASAQPVAAEPGEPAARPQLQVGVAPTGPPVIFRQGGRISGIEADLAHALATRIGKTPDFVELPFSELIPALLEGKIDIIMSGMSFTEMRAIRISFSQPYLKVGQMPLVRSRDISKYPSTLALVNTRGKVGVEYGTTGDLLVQENFLYAERVPYSDLSKAPADLVDGKIDMFIYDSPTIWWLASEYEPQGLAPLIAPLSEEFLAWGIRKDDTELLRQANAFIEEYRISGQLQALIKKWMPYARF